MRSPRLMLFNVLAVVVLVSAFFLVATYSGPIAEFRSSIDTVSANLWNPIASAAPTALALFAGPAADFTVHIALLLIGFSTGIFMASAEQRRLKRLREEGFRKTWGFPGNRSSGNRYDGCRVVPLKKRSMLGTSTT